MAVLNICTCSNINTNTQKKGYNDGLPSSPEESLSRVILAAQFDYFIFDILRFLTCTLQVLCFLQYLQRYVISNKNAY